MNGFFIESNTIKALNYDSDIGINAIGIEKNPNHLIDFLQKCSIDSLNLNMDLPSNSIHMSIERGLVDIIQEFQPQYRKIYVTFNESVLNMKNVFEVKNKEVCKKVDLNGNISFYLYMPYMYIKTNVNLFNKNIFVSLYINPKPIRSVYDRVYHAPLFNVRIHDDMTNYLCQGLTGDDYEYIKREENIKNIVNIVNNNLWNTAFNDDYVECVSSYGNSLFGNYYEWEKVSTEDPSKILKEFKKIDLPNAIILKTRSNEVYFNKSKKEVFYDIIDWLSGSISELPKNGNILNNTFITNNELFFNLQDKDGTTYIWECGERITIHDVDYIIDDIIFDRHKNDKFLLCRNIKTDAECSFSFNNLYCMYEDICQKKFEQENEILSEIELLDGSKLKKGDIFIYTWNNNLYNTYVLERVLKNINGDITLITNNGVFKLAFDINNIEKLSIEDIFGFEKGKEIIFYIDKDDILLKSTGSYEKVIISNGSFCLLFSNGLKINLIVNSDKSISLNQFNQLTTKPKFIKGIKTNFIQGLSSILIGSFLLSQTENGYKWVSESTTITPYSRRDVLNDAFDDWYDKKTKVLSISCKNRIVKYKVGDIICMYSCFNRLRITSIYFDEDLNEIRASVKFLGGVSNQIESITLCSRYGVSDDFSISDPKFKFGTTIKKITSTKIDGFRKTDKYDVVARSTTCNVKIFEGNASISSFIHLRKPTGVVCRMHEDFVREHFSL